MEEKKEILLPSKKYANAPDEELGIKLNLETSESLMRIGDRDIILDIAKLYDTERNNSNNYKIHGKLKMIFRNMYSGTTNYGYLEERLYLIGDGSNNNFTGFLPYDEFAFLRKDLYRQTFSIPAGDTLGVDYNPTTGHTGSTDHTTITAMEAPYQNWNIYLSYVYSGDSSHPMKYTLVGPEQTGGTTTVTCSFTAGDGIPFRVTEDNTSYTLTSAVPHGISEGEYIVLSGGTITSTGMTKDNTFYVNSIGNEIHNSEKYVINILKRQLKQGFTLSNIVLGKRCLDVNDITGTTSTYYVQKHKILTETKDYILDNLGFESPIWEDEKKILLENSAGVNDVIVERNRMESLLFDFKEPFVLSGLTNNLNYTPTEVFVTTVFRNGNGYFNYPPKVGYKFNFHDTWVDSHFDGDTSKEKDFKSGTFVRSGITFTSGATLSVGDTMDGAFVEYNVKELKERVISESYHKLTNPTTIFDFGQTNSNYYTGVKSTNPVGLYYQTHHRVKLRELSPYIETAKTNDILNLPENTVYDEKEKVWRWRDVYPHGYVDPDGYGTNFPFINNIHYIKMDLNFYLRNEKTYTNKQDGIKDFNAIIKKNLLC